MKKIETFSNPVGYSLNQLKQDKPSSFNGNVRVEKFIVTVEKVNEDKEVYRERLQKLWDDCDNHHQWTPIKTKAAELGIKLIGHAGTKTKK